MSPDLQTAFPVTHSVLSAEALRQHIRLAYDLGEPAACRYFNRGLTGTYEVRFTPHTPSVGPDEAHETNRVDALGAAPPERVILRVYRTGWRTDDDVHYEVDALNHLHQKGVPVAWPIAARDGSYLRTLVAPEGPRQAVLFHFAPGSQVLDRTEHAARYGRVAAQVHAATDDFVSQHA